MPKFSILTCALLLTATRMVIAQTPPLRYATLYRFTGQNGDGAYPTGSVVAGRNGHLFGTTQSGGAGPCPGNQQSGCGTIFELSPPASPGGAWTETVLYSFGVKSGDGSTPYAGLVFDAKGALYGTTVGGGTGNNGTAFVLTPPASESPSGTPWAETLLHSFAGGERDGAQPYGALVFGENGSLYGTTQKGGTQHYGTVFVLSPSPSGGAWTQRILHNFTGQVPDGFNPLAGVIRGDQGTLYGTALAFDGVVFALRPGGSGESWMETVLYTFGQQPSDGAYPFGGVTLGANGMLYGTNNSGGAFSSVCIPPVVGCGAVFELRPPANLGGSWTETTIHAFTGLNGDGANPMAGVVVGQGGMLFGTTTDGPGTVFQLAPPATAGGTWTETVLHTFTAKNGDGGDPVANLVIGPNGALYGTTMGGGNVAGKGTVFALMP